MKACGIVVEYNPFHNGHKFHANSAKERTDSDIVIAVMSGNFVQRGEPAIVSKWERTEMALHNGCDIVIELPYAFATQKAEIFAYGAVSLLQAMKCNTLVFGSENGEILPFLQSVELLEKHKSNIDALITKYVKEGLPYAKAYQLTIEELNICPPIDLSLPNNILGLEYIKAAKKLNSPMNFDTILRIHANYHDQEINNSSIASATAIRKLFSTKDKKIENVMPKNNISLMRQFEKTYGKLPTWEDFFPYLKYKILSSTPEQLKEIYEVEEGIEYRIIEKMRQSSTFEQFIQSLKTKRYTQVKLQRMCVHLLLNTKKEWLLNAQPSYIRLLGMTEAGRSYLNQVKKQIELPFIAKVSSSKDPLLQLDIKATNIYSLGLLHNQEALMKKEFSQTPIQKK